MAVNDIDIETLYQRGSAILAFFLERDVEPEPVEIEIAKRKEMRVARRFAFHARTMEHHGVTDETIVVSLFLRMEIKLNRTGVNVKLVVDAQVASIDNDAGQLREQFLQLVIGAGGVCRVITVKFIWETTEDIETLSGSFNDRSD